MSDVFTPALLGCVDQIAHALRRRGWRLATAESCTGGLVAAMLTAVAGSSDWFERGWVTYSNAAKTEALGVPAALIAAEGAVSTAVAQAMADGARTHSGADLAVSVTGIAGPGGGSATKPVGLVCFGWSTIAATTTETQVFVGDRHAIRMQAVAHALAGVLARTC